MSEVYDAFEIEIIGPKQARDGTRRFDARILEAGQPPHDVASFVPWREAWAELGAEIARRGETPFEERDR